jgi:hypothetical protein
MSNSLKAGSIVLTVALLFGLLIWSVVAFPIVGKILIGSMSVGFALMPFFLLYHSIKTELDEKSREGL